MVACVLEEAPDVCLGDRRERYSYRSYQSFLAPGRGLA
jgi:hypothetical protein